ncbi:hypothetical protein MMIC_P1586 [Mariprofundus micogutta]|uniref:Metal-binding protein n=1 Tax=Mariprofundus micogutta TaxID=1921010 RepID=A0A1L8CNZ0_9PROT|nr:DUF411 domain-containing protein [Mariprofundus micogutta]GAV20614.1 hypothetical protein MMIC_P1586 [Mariprofundus micogutta]
MKYHMRITLLWPLFLVGVMLAGCEASSATKPAAVVSESKAEIVMFKSEGCECCAGWAEHMRNAGFNVVEKKQNDMDLIKTKYGVPEKLSSCHTAIVDGYVIEGHVPANDVARLLKDRPKVTGLTAPGMPMKSPGMQAGGQSPENYDVFTFDEVGKSNVFTSY